jgi:hypothetical protein
MPPPQYGQILHVARYRRTAGAVDRDEQVKLALRRLYLSNIDMEVADRYCLNPGRGSLVAPGADEVSDDGIAATEPSFLMASNNLNAVRRSRLGRRASGSQRCAVSALCLHLQER